MSQNVPSRNDDAGVAGSNCGAVGKTCNPFLGGLTCGNNGGVGQCTCDNAAGNADLCGKPMTDPAGRSHKVASYCSSQTSLCVCVGGPNAVCDPNGSTPDCCDGSGCKDLHVDSANCGGCGTACKAGVTNAGCHDSVVDAGVSIRWCGCTAATDCRDSTTGTVNNSKWPSNTCAGGECVCSSFTDSNGGNLSACPVGSFCCHLTPRPGGGMDEGCCDKACGTAGNLCNAFIGGQKS